VRQVGYLQELNRDVRSAKHRKLPCFFCVFVLKFETNITQCLLNRLTVYSG